MDTREQEKNAFTRASVIVALAFFVQALVVLWLWILQIISITAISVIAFLFFNLAWMMTVDIQKNKMKEFECND
jgi:hypothetical protein